MALLANTHNTQILTSCVDSFLHEYKNLFYKEGLSDLPPIRGMEHHIDLSPKASFSNRPAYLSNPQ